MTEEEKKPLPPYLLPPEHAAAEQWNKGVSRILEKSADRTADERELSIMARLIFTRESVGDFSAYASTQDMRPGELSRIGESMAEDIGKHATMRDVIGPEVLSAARSMEIDDPRRQLLGLMLTKMYLPYAHKLADVYHREMQLNALDPNDYKGKASDGLREALDKALNKEKFNVRGLTGFCTTVINRRLVDQTRSDLGRKGQKFELTNARSLAFRVGDDGAELSHGDQRWSRPRVHARTTIEGTDAVDAEDSKDFFKRRMAGLLSDQEYLVMCTLIDMSNQGYKQADMARCVGLTTGTFMSHLHNARGKIAELDSGIYQRMQEELGLFKANGYTVT